MYPTTGSRTFGAFRGVFIPTFLSIIGVILFLRLGYIVGSIGIMGTIAILLLAVSITFATGLSLSSITTNIKMGGGGAFSILSTTLGIEIGGSVGIPLFLAQVFSVGIYLFGFIEAWHLIFPLHPRIYILLALFLVLFLTTFISTSFAIRAQFLVFVLVIVSLVSVLSGGSWWSHSAIVPFFNIPAMKTNFWPLFALFFPAATGLMAGIGLSGELTDPKKQIPKGVLSALAITTLIYLTIILWFGQVANPSELVSNNLSILFFSAFPSLVLFGILAATFSSALTTWIASTRVLQALAENRIIPSKILARKTESGEPRNAVFFSSIIILPILLVGSINTVAPVITMFFLITYIIINLVVFIEQSLNLPSYRPTFKVPRIIPLYGVFGSTIIMFSLNVMAGIIALMALFITYIALVKRHLHIKKGFVRSGLFSALSEWAANEVTSLDESKKHIWKPSILLPATTSEKILGTYPLVKSIIYPNGTISVLGMELEEDLALGREKLDEQKKKKELKEMPELVKKFGQQGIFSSYAHISSENYIEGICIALETIEGQFFHPNILLIPASPTNFTKKELEKIYNTIQEVNVGLMFFDKNEEMGLGSQKDIHVWLTDDLLHKMVYEKRDFDLAMLSALKLYINWKGNLKIWIISTKRKGDKAKYHIEKLLYESRFPKDTKIEIKTDSNLRKSIKESPEGDIHIIPVRNLKKLNEYSRMTRNIKRTFLFTKDSDVEDILA